MTEHEPEPIKDQEGKLLIVWPVGKNIFPQWLKARTVGTKFENVAELRLFSWIDHAGTSRTHEGKECWVCEPYHLYDGMLSDLWEMATACRLWVEIRPISHWNPGHCIRIEFTPKETPDD